MEHIWDEQELVSALGDAMQDQADMDMDLHDYAKWAVKFLQRERLLNPSRVNFTREFNQ